MVGLAVIVKFTFTLNAVMRPAAVSQREQLVLCYHSINKNNVTVQKKDCTVCYVLALIFFKNRFYCHLSGQNFPKKVPFKCAMISPSHHLPPPAVLECLNVTLEYSRKSITKLSILPPCSYLTLSAAPAPVLGAIYRMNGCPVKRWNLNVALEMDVK